MLCAKGNLLDAAVKYGKRRRRERQTDRLREWSGSPCMVPFIVGVIVKSFFAKITDAKRFLCFLMIKNTPPERKSP